MGDRIELARVGVTVLDVDRGDPTRVLFEFSADLERGEARVYAWKDGAPQPWTLPAVGASSRLPGNSPF